MAVPPPPSPDKPALRTRRRAFRAALIARGGLDDALADAAARVLPHIAPGALVALYHPFGDEIDPMPLVASLTARGHELALPHVAAGRGRMRFLAWHPAATLVAGTYGLHQPHEDAGEVRPDLILTPLVGFDRAGGRMGQGAGYYDRAFADARHAIRIGFAWSVQEVDMIPQDPWDVPLHAIATEREWIVPGVRP